MMFVHSPGTTPDRLGTMGNGSLRDAVSCVVTRKLSGGVCELEMEYKTGGACADSLQPDYIIMAPVSPESDRQPFRIDKVTRLIGSTFKVYAIAEATRAKNIVIMPFSASTLTTALQALPANAVGAFPFDIFATFPSSKPFSLRVPTPLQDVLFGSEGSLVDVYGGEWFFDGYTMRFSEPSEAREIGLRVAYGKNLVDAQQEALLRKCLTGIVPYWASDTDGVVVLPEKVISTISLLAYPHIEPVDFSGDFPTKPTAAQLRARATEWMKSNRVTEPEVSISTSFLPIPGDYTGGPVALGDIVTVDFELIGIKSKARIVGYKYNVLKDRYESIDIGRSRQTFAETIAALIKGG